MASTKKLLQSVGTSTKRAEIAVAQALDPKFPWDEATILRVSGNNPKVAQALGIEAKLTKAPKAPKAKRASAWLKAHLTEAETLVAHLKALGSHLVVIVTPETTIEQTYTATLGDPTIGPRGGVQVMCTLHWGTQVAATYELSGKQAARLFAGGNCGTTVGHVLHSA